MKTNKQQELLAERCQLYLDEEEFELEMADFKAIDRRIVDYAKLDDQGDNFSMFHTKPSYNALNQKPQRIFTDKTITPITSYNPQPAKIVINGATFIHIDAIKGQARTLAKPKKPEMQVQCAHCCSLQMVPANTHSFICYNCDCTQGCIPECGVFVCGSCQRKVWYPLGKSDTIKCTKCWTVNWVAGEGQQQAQGGKPYFQNLGQTNQSQEKVGLNEKYFTQRYPIL